MDRISITNISRIISKYVWIISGTLITMGVLVLYALQLSVPVISDETITMSNAAWMDGKDWSLMIAAIGGYYYRYIQALMTIPFFAYFEDNPEMIYKMSLTLQAVVQASIVPIVYFICVRHLGVVSKILAVMLGMVTCFVPAAILYTYYYRGDYLLGVFPWYVLFFLLEIIRAYEKKRKYYRILLTILITTCCVMSYMAHTRGIVVSIASIIVILFCKICLRKYSVHFVTFVCSFVFLLMIDSYLTNILKNALYSVSGMDANSFDSVNMEVYFDVFSKQSIKEIIILCISWMNTLIVTNQGLVWIGMCTIGSLVYKFLCKEKNNTNNNEIVVILFSFLIFTGYYIVGVLFFKGVYNPLLIGENTRRVDRLLYDRYSICGASMMVFIAMYALCYKKDWFEIKNKIFALSSSIVFLFFCVWKIFPLIQKYTGYIYNTIILNTFQLIENPDRILLGEYYDIDGIIKISILGLTLMIILLILSSFNKKGIPYLILVIVLSGELFFVHVNYVKIRKSSNDYVLDATQEIVKFMRAIDNEIVEEYPYILKGGMSGIKIQFYQSQLMNYIMFGKRQEEELNLENYFIISKQDDIDISWMEDDFYLFSDFDYEKAQYDIVYVKGEKLMQMLEDFGYEMYQYNAVDKNR